MQKDSKILDDLARLGTSALGSVIDIKRELEAMVSAQLEKLLQKMNLVTREEHDVVRLIAIKAREENENMQKRLGDLEQVVSELTQK